MSEFWLNFLIGLLLAYGLAALFIFWSEGRGAPWVPTPMDKVRKMLAMAEVKPGDVVYDLGSGDGRVIITAAREFGAQAVGVEVDLLRYLWTRLWIALHGLQGQVRVIWGDMYELDISQADVVALYLRRRTNELLMVKLLLELCPHTRVVSHMFTFPHWEPVSQDEQARIFVYRVGMRDSDQPGS
ncbi:MAG: class I SAM-dependent methyltransferase [Chloroflexota bacterium]